MRSAHVNLALSMILVGLSVPTSKLVVSHVPPLAAAFLRFLMVALLLAPVALRRGRGALPASTRDWISIVLLSLFGMVLFNVFLLFGLRATSAVTAGILTSTIPAMTALCAALVLGERIGAGTAGAIALAVLGILALNLQAGEGGADGAAESLAGTLLVCGAVLSEALYGVFARRLGGRMRPLALTFLSNTLAAAMIAPAAAATARGFDPAAVPVEIWALFAGSGIGSGLIAVLLWMRGIAQVPASRAGLYTGLIPVAGVAAAVLVLGERLTPAHGLGLACVLVAIALGTGVLRRRSAGAGLASRD
ncbi:DMT family transporter [Arenibaculum pallidiluteum]|uniref:DMT family transporter n=1 Tax=Arenibaculum pallidiluteum TaxID=2812559 RepID=UPI001A95EB65|nr:DMT family transporter [Arenibaculum pallidiluteum]